MRVDHVAMFQLLCWDEKSFYMEHRFERQRDNFINAIVVLKVTVTGSTPQLIVDAVEPGLTSPSPPPEVSKWMESTTLSSERLRKDL